VPIRVVLRVRTVVAGSFRAPPLYLNALYVVHQHLNAAPRPPRGPLPVGARHGHRLVSNILALRQRLPASVIRLLRLLATSLFAEEVRCTCAWAFCVCVFVFACVCVCVRVCMCVCVCALCVRVRALTVFDTALNRRVCVQRYCDVESLGSGAYGSVTTCTVKHVPTGTVPASFAVSSEDVAVGDVVAVKRLEARRDSAVAAVFRACASARRRVTFAVVVGAAVVCVCVSVRVWLCVCLWLCVFGCRCRRTRRPAVRWRRCSRR
jgi:hypothetical protein